MSESSTETVARYEDLLGRHVLPLALFEKIEGGYATRALLGTAFVLGSNTVVTCWHCVQAPLDDGQVYGVGLRPDVYSDHYDEMVPLLDLAQASGGIDLAIARADMDLSPKLSLAPQPLAWGAEAVTMGYPLPARTAARPPSGPGFASNARLLRGYVTRIVSHDDPRWTPARAYELDMPAPGGLSGGPLVDLAQLEVSGVICGWRPYEERDDPDDPEAPVRIHPFAIAYHLTTLRNARGPATGEQPLGEFLAR